MIKLLLLLVISVALAYASQQKTNEIVGQGQEYVVWKDPAYLALATVMILFTGLRTSYNDTWNYRSLYENSQGLAWFFSNPENWNVFKNPLFIFYNCLLHDCGASAQVLIFTTSLLTQLCFLRMFKRYSASFVLSVFIYITLGTFNFSMAAMKQVCAMGITTLAFPALEKRKWVLYYGIVFVAMLIHTYALAFAVLPLFRRIPWSWFTYVFVLVVVAVMLNFEEAITRFMEQANEAGKTLEEYEIFDEHTVNILRVAVYAVTPVLSFFFIKWIRTDATDMDYVLVHMSIISFAFMIMGTRQGANMFSRMAHYFELGTICCLPRMLQQTFDERSYRLVRLIAVVCFFGFFFYANVLGGDFGSEYRSLIW